MVTNGTPENQPGDQLLNYAEAAAFLRISVSTVKWYVHRREIPFRKVGRHTRFLRAELDAWSKRSARPKRRVA